MRFRMMERSPKSNAPDDILDHEFGHLPWPHFGFVAGAACRRAVKVLSTTEMVIKYCHRVDAGTDEHCRLHQVLSLLRLLAQHALVEGTRCTTWVREYLRPGRDVIEEAHATRLLGKEVTSSGKLMESNFAGKLCQRASKRE